MPDGPQFMKAAEFQKRFRVSHPYDESLGWENLSEDEDFWEGPIVRRTGDIDASNMDEMEKHIRKHGIQTPVRVSGNEVINGHHRVWIAGNISPDFKIPYIDTSED